MFPEDDLNRIIPKKKRSRVGLFLIGGFVIVLGGAAYFDLFAIFFEYEAWEFIIFGLFFIFSLISGFFQRQLASRTLKTYVEEINLKAIDNKLATAASSYTGTYKGHQFIFAMTSTQQGKNRRHQTQFIFILREPIKETFSLQQRSFMHYNRELTGDDEIDQAYTIKSSNARLIKHLLMSRQIRQGFLELRREAKSPQLSISGERIIYQENEFIADANYLLAVTNLVSHLTHRIEQHTQFNIEF